MKWYAKLYLGDSVKHPRRLKWKIDHNAGSVRVYVIVLAAGEQEQLYIIPSWVLLQKGYPDKKNLFIVGLAGGYQEALEVVRRMAQDVYINTGDLDIRRWIREHREDRK